MAVHCFSVADAALCSCHSLEENKEHKTTFKDLCQ